MKSIQLSSVSHPTVLETGARLLDGLLAEHVNVLMACGGRGRCATCHVYVEAGAASLSPMTDREQRTLQRISTCHTNSRLACQARVLGPGVMVRVPGGEYATDKQTIERLVGKRASSDILHPITGRVLAEAGRLITRTLIMQLRDVDFDVDAADPDRPPSRR